MIFKHLKQFSEKNLIRRCRIFMIFISVLFFLYPLVMVLYPLLICFFGSPDFQIGVPDSFLREILRSIDLHHDVFFFMVVILIFVLWIGTRTLYHFHHSKNPVPEKIIHGTTIEIAWTVAPSLILVFIAIPSFVLLYSLDEVVDPAVTIGSNFAKVTDLGCSNLDISKDFFIPTALEKHQFFKKVSDNLYSDCLVLDNAIEIHCNESDAILARTELTKMNEILKVSHGLEKIHRAKISDLPSNYSTQQFAMKYAPMLPKKSSTLEATGSSSSMLNESLPREYFKSHFIRCLHDDNLKMSFEFVESAFKKENDGEDTHEKPQYSLIALFGSWAFCNYVRARKKIEPFLPSKFHIDPYSFQNEIFGWKWK